MDKRKPGRPKKAQPSRVIKGILPEAPEGLHVKFVYDKAAVLASITSLLKTIRCDDIVFQFKKDSMILHGVNHEKTCAARVSFEGKTLPEYYCSSGYTASLARSSLDKIFDGHDVTAVTIQCPTDKSSLLPPSIEIICHTPGITKKHRFECNTAKDYTDATFDDYFDIEEYELSFNIPTKSLKEITSDAGKTSTGATSLLSFVKTPTTQFTISCDFGRQHNIQNKFDETVHNIVFDPDLHLEVVFTTENVRNIAAAKVQKITASVTSNEPGRFTADFDSGVVGNFIILNESD